jgi:DNA-binding SARP family transcriptional activator
MKTMTTMKVKEIRKKARGIIDDEDEHGRLEEDDRLITDLERELEDNETELAPLSVAERREACVVLSKVCLS